METNVDTQRNLLVELQATVNLGMVFNRLIVVIHNERPIHLLHVKTFQNNIHLLHVKTFQNNKYDFLKLS